MNIEAEKMIQKAFWLTPLQKEIIAEAICRTATMELVKQEQIKLLVLLCCIPYAEDKLRLHSKDKGYLRVIEKIFRRLHLKQFFGRCFGIWHFNVCHAQRFGMTLKQFIKLLEDDSQGVDVVIAFIVKDIGLNKPIHHLFAEYNHQIYATSIAALQKALNELMKIHHCTLSLTEDGIIGEQTWAALHWSDTLFQRPLLPDPFTEQDIHRALDQIAVERGIHICPFIPQVQIKMDFRFIGNILLQALQKPSQLKKIKLALHNHIDVPLYVNFGMQAYHHLT